MKCNKCNKDNIKLANYPIHVLFCAEPDDPVAQNMFKSQIHMTQQLHQLIKDQ